MEKLTDHSRDRQEAPPPTSPPPHASPNEHDNSKPDSRLLKTWRWIRATKVYGILSWTPPMCRWDPDNPPKFSMALNVLFAFAGCFTVANLYYSHPILNVLARDFGVPYETVSQIPTLMQAGYATGLLFLCPLGDHFRRRPFVLILVFFTATVWYVLSYIRCVPRLT